MQKFQIKHSNCSKFQIKYSKFQIEEPIPNLRHCERREATKFQSIVDLEFGIFDLEFFCAGCNIRLLTFVVRRVSLKLKPQIMRKVFFVFVASFFASLCFAQNKETIEGNGKTVTRDVSVSSFDALKAKGVYELKIIQ